MPIHFLYKMIRIEKKLFGRITELFMYNDASGCYFSTVPEFGAAMHRLVFSKGGASFNILKKWDDPDVYPEEYSRISPGSLLFPFPNRLAGGRFTFQGKSYTFPMNDPGLPNALHGFVSDKPFEISEIDNKTGRVKLVYSYDGEENKYPFPFRLTVIYTLGRNALTSETIVENSGPSDMPFGLGWHPYFDLGEPIAELQMYIPAEGKYEVDEHIIPTQRLLPFNEFQNFRIIAHTVIDHCCKIRPDASVTKLKSDRVGIEIRLDEGKRKYNYVQYYIPPDKESIAIEPMTCPPDALNSGEGLIVLKPGATAHFCFSIKMM